MKYTQKRNAKLMILMIVSVWLLSALISIPPLFGWGRASKTLQQEGICLVSQDFRYQIYATLLAFYIPLLVMIIVYINIYRTAKEIKEKEKKTCIRLNNSYSYVPVSKYSPILSNNEVKNNKKTCSNSSIKQYQLPVSNKPSAKFDIEIKFAENKVKVSKFPHSRSVSETSNRTTSNLSTHSKLNSSSSSSSPDANTITNSKRQFKFRLTRRLTDVFSGIKRQSNSPQGKNQKATKTLGIIMGCFILCWLPFFLLAVLKPIPLKNGKKIRDFIPGWLDSLLLWLGYFNSAINPIIYARFNREFRRPFIEILCFRCLRINEKLRNEDRKKIYVDCIPINNMIYKESASSAVSSGFNSFYTKKYQITNEKNNDNLENPESSAFEPLHIVNNVNNQHLQVTNTINKNFISFEIDRTTVHSDDECNKKYDTNLIKEHKLNELVSSRFYNLTIIDGMKTSYDKSVLSLKIETSKKHASKRKKKQKKAFKEEIKPNLEETSKHELVLRDKNCKLLKQQSLNDNKIKQNLIIIKQSASTDEFKSSFLKK